MQGADWIALLKDAEGLRAVALRDGAVLADQHFGSEAEARAAFGDAPVLRPGEGRPDTVPCGVLPETGLHLPVITQDAPAGVLGGDARLWIAGFLAQNRDWDGVLCVQEGDVTHWVHVSADEVVSFASFLTLRIAAALGGGDRPDAQALADSQSRPERLAAHLREAELSGNPAAVTGHLIGAELTAARVYWLGQQLALISPGGDGTAHAEALRALNVPFTAQRPEELVAQGLLALDRQLGPGRVSG